MTINAIEERIEEIFDIMRMDKIANIQGKGYKITLPKEQKISDSEGDGK